MDKIFKIAGNLKWPFAIGMLAFLVWKQGGAFGALWHTQKNWGFFALGFVLITASVASTFVRWYLLVWAQEFDFSLKEAFRLSGFGMLCNYGGPGIVGGDLLKAAIVAKNQQSRRAVAAATVVLDRVLGLLALFMVGAVSTLIVEFPPGAMSSAEGAKEGLLASIPPLMVVAWGLWIGCIVGTGAVVVMLLPGSTHWPLLQKLVSLKYVGKTFSDLLNGIAMYQTKRRVVVLAVLISIFGQGGLVAGFYCCAKSLNMWVPSLWTHYYFMPAAELFASVIPVPGGLGPLEGAISYFYGLTAPAEIGAKAAEATGLAAALVFRVIHVTVSVLGGTYYLFTKKDGNFSTNVEDELAIAADPQPSAAAPSSIAAE